MRSRTSRIGIIVHVSYTADMVTPQLPLWSDKDAAEAWVVRESTRARRLTVRVFHTGRVEVVVPARTSPRAVEHFLERHRDWIERKRHEARQKAVPDTPFPPPRIELAACDESWRVYHAGGEGRARLTVMGPGLLAFSGNYSENKHAMRQQLRRWL